PERSKDSDVQSVRCRTQLPRDPCRRRNQPHVHRRAVVPALGDDTGALKEPDRGFRVSSFGYREPTAGLVRAERGVQALDDLPLRVHPLDEPLVGEAIAERMEQDAVRGLAIASRATRFLIVRLE